MQEGSASVDVVSKMSFLLQVFLPGFLSSNLYYKYLNDLIHSVRGDEFLGGSVALAAHGSACLPEESHSGGSDGATAQVLADCTLYQWGGRHRGPFRDVLSSRYKIIKAACL